MHLINLIKVFEEKKSELEMRMDQKGEEKESKIERTQKRMDLYGTRASADQAKPSQASPAQLMDGYVAHKLSSLLLLLILLLS